VIQRSKLCLPPSDWKRSLSLSSLSKVHHQNHHILFKKQTVTVRAVAAGHNIYCSFIIYWWFIPELPASINKKKHTDKIQLLAHDWTSRYSHVRHRQASRQLGHLESHLTKYTLQVNKQGKISLKIKEQLKIFAVWLYWLQLKSRLPSSAASATRVPDFRSRGCLSIASCCSGTDAETGTIDKALIYLARKPNPAGHVWSTVTKLIWYKINLIRLKWGS
jgi:hypothetical protein